MKIKDELITTTTRKGETFICKVCPKCKRICKLSGDFGGKTNGQKVCNECMN